MNWASLAAAAMRGNKYLAISSRSAACGRLRQQEITMAKGQVRGNKETRKPKKDKSEAATASTAGSQVKLAGSSTPFGRKEKK